MPVLTKERPRKAFIKLWRVPAGCSGPPCDWCGATSIWLAFDVGQLMGASCAQCYPLLRRSVVMSENHR
jgi:hypothetical protein